MAVCEKTGCHSIYRYEIRANLKSLLLWAVCVGGMGFACILLFPDVKENMGEVAESFASMGAFSDAFGMSQLNIATLVGFYATEVGTIHALGGAMFAAMISTTMLSKEEDGHTGEFLFSLPIGKGKVVAAKWCAIMTHVALFNLFCVGMYLGGIMSLGETIPTENFILYHMLQLLMQMEIAAICYAVSAFLKKNRLGLGLGIVLFLYVYDLISRVAPNLSDHKAISPFSYANAADVLGTGEAAVPAVLIGCMVLMLGVCAAHIVYGRRDLAA